jgi:hypothetical protein
VRLPINSSRDRKAARKASTVCAHKSAVNAELTTIYSRRHRRTASASPSGWSGFLIVSIAPSVVRKAFRLSALQGEIRGVTCGPTASAAFSTSCCTGLTASSRLPNGPSLLNARKIPPAATSMPPKAKHPREGYRGGTQHQLFPCHSWLICACLVLAMSIIGGARRADDRILSCNSPVSMKRATTIDATTRYGDLVLRTAPLSLRYFAHAGLFFSSIDQPAAFSVPQKRNTLTNADNGSSRIVRVVVQAHRLRSSLVSPL